MAESSSTSANNTAAESENNVTKSTPVHKRIHYTKSNPSFHSMEYLAVQRQDLIDDGRRSRSNSAPLSREAIKVAHNLREASDNFVKSKHRMINRKRRRTLGSFMHKSIEKEYLQATLHEDDENTTPLLGTPV